MQRLCVKAIATIIVLGAGVVATTAKADMNYGPMRNGDQCFTKSKGTNARMFGYWGPCPQPAAAELQSNQTVRAEGQRHATVRHLNRATR